MQYTSESVEALVEQFSKLPTIGRKTAQRLASFVLKMPREEVVQIAEALVAVKDRVLFCSICYNVADHDPCAICRSPRRDRSTICVVEEPSDVQAIERTGEFRGVYHVLGGAISPLDGIGPDDLRVRELATRIDPAFGQAAAAGGDGQPAAAASATAKEPPRVAEPDAAYAEPDAAYAEPETAADEEAADERAADEAEERVPVEEVILAVNPNVEGDTTAYYIAQLLKPLNVPITRIARGLPIGGDLEYADEATLARALEGRGRV